MIFTWANVFNSAFAASIIVLFPSVILQQSNPLGDEEAELRKLVKIVESRKQGLLPCRVESIRTLPMEGAHQWHRITWFGGLQYVVEVGKSVPISESLSEIADTSRYDELVLGNDSYFAYLSKFDKTGAQDGTTFGLLRLDERGNRGFPHAVHPLVDSMRIGGIFDNLEQLFESGQLHCSWAKNNSGILVVEWEGNKQEKPVSIELEFDMERSICTKQKTAFSPTEWSEISFEYQSESVDAIPEFVTYRGAIGEFKHEDRYEIACVERSLDKPTSCFVSHYGLPEPAFSTIENFKLKRRKVVAIGLLLFIVVSAVCYIVNKTRQTNSRRA